MTMLLAATRLVCAADPNADAQVEKLGALRLRLSVKINEINKLTDNSANGSNKASDSLLLLYSQVRNDLTKQIQTENAKGDSKDQLMLNALTAKAEKLDNVRLEQGSRDWPVFTGKMSALYYVANNLNIIFQNAGGVDQAWLRAGLDPATLTAAFAALSMRADEVKAEAAILVDDFKKLCESREKQIKE